LAILARTSGRKFEETYTRLELDRGEIRTVVSSVKPWDGFGAWALLAPIAIGICRSDLRELLGDRPVRRDFGHEIVGSVVAAEPAELSHLVQLPAVCLDPHPPVDRTSGFGELVEITGSPESVNEALRPLPTALADKIGILVEPLACASHCLQRVQASGPSRARRAAVIGAGIAGCLIALGLDSNGWDITLYNRSRPRLDLLSQRNVLAAARLRELSAADRSYAVVVIATTELDTPAFDAARKMVIDDGTIILFSGTRPAVTIDGLDVDSIRRQEANVASYSDGRRVSVKGTHGATKLDFDNAIALLMRPGLDAPRARLERLLGPELTLRQAAGQMIRHARDGFVGKPYVRPVR
jgi:cyclitol reductase